MACLTRPEFERACLAYVQKHNNHSDIVWEWVDHPKFRLGYLGRQITIHAPAPAPRGEDYEMFENAMNDEDKTVVVPEDISVLNPQTSTALICKQYICYSTTFQVPVFYFTISHQDGSALPLLDVMKTPLLKVSNLGPAETTSFALTQTLSSFPLLSQGDHPTLGTPCWYLHPCETPNAVMEIVKARLGTDMPPTMGDQVLLAWLESWIAVLSTVISLDLC